MYEIILQYYYICMYYALDKTEMNMSFLECARIFY